MADLREAFVKRFFGNEGIWNVKTSAGFHIFTHSIFVADNKSAFFGGSDNSATINAQLSPQFINRRLQKTININHAVDGRINAIDECIARFVHFDQFCGVNIFLKLHLKSQYHPTVVDGFLIVTSPLPQRVLHFIIKPRSKSPDRNHAIKRETLFPALAPANPEFHSSF